MKRQVFEARLLWTRHICLCGLFVFAAAALFPKARAQSSRSGPGVDGSGLNVESRSQAGLAKDAGEFYLVEGRKIRLLRSLKKVAVHHAPDRGRAINERLKGRQGIGRLFVVEQELALNYKQQFLGQTLQVLVESTRDRSTGLLAGFTGNYIRVRLDGPDHWQNSVKDVRLFCAGPQVAYGLTVRRFES